jgi:competence protein CoiA
MAIYDALLQAANVRKPGLERKLKTVRPDVRAYINNVPIAIEVQISALSLDTIIHRTIEYERHGVYLLWLPQWSPGLDDERYSPRVWERWVHAAYYGRVYYWLEGPWVLSYQFAPYNIYVEPTSWYGPGGEMKSAGGYERQSKRFRTPVRGKLLNLLTEFVPCDRDAWQSRDWMIPRAKLYMDRYPNLKLAQS